jgi:hypothetical protein
MTHAQAEALHGLPDGLVSSRTVRWSSGARHRALGDTMSLYTILPAILAQLRHLRGFAAVNALLLFNGIGAAGVALVDAHLAGTITLNALICVEIDTKRHTAFAAWFTGMQQKHPSLRRVQRLHVGDITSLYATDIRRLLHSVGGAHIIVGGSPCSGFSGNNQGAQPRTGRLGLQNDQSALFYEFARWVQAAALVERAFWTGGPQDSD